MNRAPVEFRQKNQSQLKEISQRNKYKGIQLNPFCLLRKIDLKNFRSSGGTPVENMK